MLFHDLPFGFSHTAGCVGITLHPDDYPRHLDFAAHVAAQSITRPECLHHLDYVLALLLVGSPRRRSPIPTLSSSPCARCRRCLGTARPDTCSSCIGFSRCCGFSMTTHPSRSVSGSAMPFLRFSLTATWTVFAWPCGAWSWGTPGASRRCSKNVRS